ncbi:hypothetical protein ACFV0B_12895 [Streptomyces xanthophaeus]|uniref:hypothetical protein n=1 Tax=Streptomyces xanthophaeus TaxID=67385 RepID=UPI0036AD6AD3
MTKLLLSLHVLAAVLAVGPVTVAASMFPKALRHADGAPDDPGALATLRTLHRICRVYAGIGIAVPVFGFATAGSLGVLGSGWLITSVVLTAAAAAVLGLLILPTQDEALAAAQAPGPSPRPGPGAGPGPGPASRTTAARLAMLTGVFNLLWAIVTVLMIVRPGSTTGA